MTGERTLELLAELSLIDLSRLALFKAGGPEGLSSQGASTMKSESVTHEVIIRCKSKKRMKREARKSEDG